MTLDKQVLIDRIEVIENGTVQVRQATIITEDGNQISRTFHRWIIVPSQDYSDQDDKVKAICQVTHTPEVIATYKAQIEANKLGTA